MINNSLKYLVGVIVNVGSSSGILPSHKKSLHEAIVLNLESIFDVIMPP